MKGHNTAIVDTPHLVPQLKKLTQIFNKPSLETIRKKSRSITEKLVLDSKKNNFYLTEID
jgi:hypothetical protein